MTLMPGTLSALHGRQHAADLRNHRRPLGRRGVRTTYAVTPRRR